MSHTCFWLARKQNLFYFFFVSELLSTYAFYIYLNLVVSIHSHTLPVFLPLPLLFLFPPSHPSVPKNNDRVLNPYVAEKHWWPFRVVNWYFIFLKSSNFSNLYIWNLFHLTFYKILKSRNKICRNLKFLDLYTYTGNLGKRESFLSDHYFCICGYKQEIERFAQPPYFQHRK